MQKAKLTRSNSDKILAGVCGGLAAYLDVDAVLVRLAFVVLLFSGGIGAPLYLLMWVITPQEGEPERPNAETIQKNISELKGTVSGSVSRLGQPNAVGVLLIILGVYFLFRQIGWFSWFSGPIFWSLVIIGFGVYLLVRRSR